MDIQPAQPGECLIIPKSHIDHFTDIPDDLAADIMVTAQNLGRRIREVFSPKRVGMVVHGFGVPHAHLILVPQRNADDITSGRLARIENGNITFDITNIAKVSRDELDRQAERLRM